MKNLMLIFCLAFSLVVSAQQVDTVIENPILKSYFCEAYKEPLYVVYDIYKAGGDVSRAGITFKGIEGITENAVDYYSSGYQEGHLGDAKDFSNTMQRLLYTFWFYNCLPQKAKLNIGIWKTWETWARQESQTEKLHIVAGGFDFFLYKFKNKKGKEHELWVPKYCYKIIYGQDGQIEHCLLFPNDDSDSVQEITLADLEQKLDYTLNF